MTLNLEYKTVNKIRTIIGHRPIMGMVSDMSVEFTIGRFGVILVIGRSRSGKSSNVKTIIAQASQTPRRILVIDPYGEYKTCLHPNIMSRPISMGFRNFKVISEPTFKISEFKKIDYMSMGLSDAAAQLATLIGQATDKHQEDFEVYKEIISDMPTTIKDLPNFQKKWSIDEVSIVHSQTHTQMMEKIAWMGNMFWQGVGIDNVTDANNRTYIESYTSELNKHNLIIDLGLKKGSDKMKAVIYTAIILRQLEPYLKILKPIIVIEESDIICPNPMRIGTLFMPSAAMVLSDYCLKLQRDDVVLFMITQDHDLLYPELVNNWHYKILGILDPKSRDAEYVRGLNNEFESTNKGYREFVLLSASNKIKRFVPVQCPCEL